MTPATRAWLAGLREFAAAHRAERAAAGADQPPAEAAGERTILAAHLVGWFADVEGLLAARAAWARAYGGERDPDPALVLTTSVVGLDATAGVLGSGEPLAAALATRVACVTELEYRLWCIRAPDDGWRRHVNHWNWIKTRVPPRRAAEFARHPLAAGESYWLHRTGTSGAGAADRRDCGLWKWNGRHAALLEPHVRERSVGPLAPGGTDPG